MKMSSSVRKNVAATIFFSWKLALMAAAIAKRLLHLQLNDPELVALILPNIRRILAIANCASKYSDALHALLSTFV